jgi:hypothetical protein
MREKWSTATSTQVGQMPQHHTRVLWSDQVWLGDVATIRTGPRRRFLAD